MRTYRRERGANRQQPEYELIDTGVFDDGRYWITEVTLCQGGAGPTY